MTKLNLSTIIKYNNWEKLNDMHSLINNKNYHMLLCTSIRYHSKECFDILIAHPKNKEYINTLSGYHYISFVFENYINGPNKSNEYYIDKIFPLVAFINSESIEYILKNTNLFGKFFNNIDISESSLNYLFRQICMNNNVEIFNIVYNHIKNNPNHFPFFNNGWVNKNILYNCLIFDNVEVLKVLNELKHNIDHVLWDNIQISSLVLSLVDATNKTHDLKCFKYLITKTTTDQNLLWSVHLRLKQYPYCNQFYKLNINWDFNYDKLNELTPLNNMENLEQNNNPELTNENLGLQILNDDDFYNGFIDFNNFESVVNILYNLTQMQLTNPDPKVKKYLENINKIPNIDIINNLTFYLCLLVKHSIIIKRRIKRKQIIIDKIIKTLKIIEYFKINKLSTYNPIIKINEHMEPNAKKIFKKVILFLAKLSYDIPDNIKTELFPKIFTKKEITNWDTMIKSYNEDLILKNIKNINKSSMKYRPKYKRSKMVLEQDDDELDDEEQNDVNNDIEL